MPSVRDVARNDGPDEESVIFLAKPAQHKSTTLVRENFIQGGRVESK